MEYPEGCRQGDKQLFCAGCAPKQQQACGDNHRIIQAKKKAHGGKTNTEIHLEDNLRIKTEKVKRELESVAAPEGDENV